MKQVLFLHIHKCGGTSLRHMLNTVYPIHEQLPVPVKGETVLPHPYRTIDQHTSSYWQDAPQKDINRYALIMGHYDWRMVTRVQGEPLVLTMLRNPIDQLISQFQWFERDKKTYGNLYEKFQHTGIEGFINSPYVARFANQQSKFLSGHFWGFSDVNAGHVLNAKRNIRNRALYGLVERWDDSIQLFETALGVSLPHEHRNRSAQRTPVLTPALREQIEAVQAHDISLYAYAVKHFAEQF